MSNNNNKNKQPLDEASTTTPITDPMGFLLGCAKKGGDRKKHRPPTICKVSRILRDLSKDSFNPQLVSIGPIHREDPNLKEFEWLKECYLHDLLHREDPKLKVFEWLKEFYLHDALHRDSTPEKKLEACLLKVNTLIPQIRESYGGMIEKYSDNEVATMMVMDGCFILEFCSKLEEEMLSKMQNSRIAMDLLLLENQVPFFVLQALFDCSMGEGPFFTLSNVLDKFLACYINIFRSRSLLPETTIHFDSDSTPDHVLGYLHKRYQLVVAKPPNPIHAEALKLVAAKSLIPIRSLISKLVAAKSLIPIRALKLKLVAAKSLIPIRALKSKLVAAKTLIPKRTLKSKLVAAKTLIPILSLISKLVDKKVSKNTHIAFHSVVELDRSGINFKPHQEGGWSMTIKFQSSLFACLPWFWSKPTLLMPILDIHDDTELILRNLIAYEQSFAKDRYYFTSYALAMDMLIDTQEDIAKLVESKVIVNELGSNQEAAEMINKICKNIIISKFYYKQEFKKIDKYYNALWPKHMARLRRVYFNNPWNSIALLAAIILFALTVVQTVYAIKGK